MTPDLGAIRARLAAATPGPWHAETSDATMDDRNLWRVRRDVQPQALLHLSAIMSSGNADLIAHAPADLAALADEVEALRAAVERVREVALAEDDEEWVRRVGMSCLVSAASILEALDGAE